MPKLHFLSLLCTISLFAAPSLQQQCYFPNGQPVKAGSLGAAVPCPGVDACCLQGDVCFSGGMCFSSENGATYRGYCVQKNWSTSSTCPGECSNSSTGTGFMWVNACGGQQSCCAGNDNSVNCCGGDKFFWEFEPIGYIGSMSPSTPSSTTSMSALNTSTTSTGPVAGTTTIVATVRSVDTLISYTTTGPKGGSAGAVVSTTTVTVQGQSGARGRCDGMCGFMSGLGTLALLWL